MSTFLTVRERREVLFEKMLDGNTPTKLKEEWMFDNPSKTKHSYDKDITWCYKKLQEFGADSANDIIRQHVIMYDKNIEEARSLGAIGAANQAMQYKEKLLGFHKPESIINIQNNTLQLGFEQIGLEELKGLIETKDE